MIFSLLRNRLTFIFTISLIVADESWKVYDDSEIAIINISIDPDALDWIYDNAWSDSLHVASIQFQNAYINQSVDSIGFRIRGNTSRGSEKKSFKIDFNHFIGGRDFFNVEKLNLNGEHNDPSIIRSKLCWDMFQQIGVTSSRASHARLYINGSYYGLYISIEHIDDSFVSKNYDNGNGNLWKCIWPADLTYRGDNPEDYYPYHNDTRPYELKTNKDEYDYSKLARLVNVIHHSPDSLDIVLDTKELLQYFAINIITGSWDDYRFLRNNFYIYHNPSDDLIHWIPYDYDNTFGIDWFDIDWSTIDPYNYPVIDNDGRPLTEFIFSNDRYRDIYTHFLEFYLNELINIESIEMKLNYFLDHLYSAALEDVYRTMDYGFSIEDFVNSYGEDFEVSHVKHGILEFLQNRKNSLQEQLEYVHELPIIYDAEIENKTILLGDTIKINSSLIADPTEATFNILYSLDGSDQWLTAHLDFNPDNSSSLVEEHDRWTIELIPNYPGNYDWYLQAYSNSGFERHPIHGVNTFKIINSSSNQPIIINELLAKNETTNSDESGEFDDWVELYNYSDNLVDLAGYYLTDKNYNLMKWQFPEVGSIIEPQGYMLVWCDEDQEQGTLHSNFKLSTNGEFLALVMPDGQTILDSITFPNQNSDISFGRVSQGQWDYLNPSPNGTNIALSVNQESSLSTKFEIVEVYPNPFNSNLTVSINLIEKIDILDVKVISLSGQVVKSIKYYPQVIGNSVISLNLDNMYASGYYFIKVQYLDQVFTTKVLYLK